MKILFISPNSPFLSVGGVERSVRNLIDYYAKREDETFFILPSFDGDTDLKTGNAKIFQREFLSVSSRDKSGKSQVGSLSKITKQKSQKFFRFIRKTIWEEKIDVVVVENFHLGLLPAFSLMLNMACFNQRIPLVLRVHSFAVKPIQEELINNLFWKKIICVSTSVAGDCFTKGADIEKLSTKYLGVNLDQFNSQVDRFWLKNKLGLKPEHKVILSASRIITGIREILKEKGLINLIEAFSKVASKNDNVRLVFAVGQPPANLQNEFISALEKLKGYARLHGVDDKVFYEQFSLDQMPQVYSGGDVFVLPSENETFGQVYIEAMACGTPVIGTNVGGIPEIINNQENGFLVAPNDASALANRIEKLLDDEETRAQFIKKATETVQGRFSVEVLNSDLYEFIKDLVPKVNLNSNETSS